MPIETYTIFPTNKYNRPAPPATITLHGLDLLSPPLQIRNHRFYRCPTSTFSEAVDELKSSLAEALELYLPVAGTVVVKENGEVYIATDAANILGTPFLVDVKDTPYTVDGVDLSPRSDIMLPPLSSSLAVKVTQFSCGTIVVATSINHQVADLRGFLDFLELWASLARGEPVDFTAIPDDWSRNPSRFFPDLTNEAAATVPFPRPFTVLPSPATAPPSFFMVPSEITTWKFTKSSMAQLKSDFSPPKESNSWISTGDALAALVSGVITRARETSNIPRLDGRSSVESQTETIALAGDGRERSPEKKMVGGRYFGNFNNLWSATVSRADLLSPTCESGSRLAVSIRNSLDAALSPEAIAKRIAFFDNPQNTQPPGRIVWSADLISTNWCQFDLQGPKLDFGWGKPFRATGGSFKVLPPGYFIITKDMDSETTLVVLTVENEGGDVLKADPLLNKYATLIPNY